MINFPTLASFGHDTWWIVVGKAVAIFLFLVLTVLVAILAERKIMARMQRRLGPNRVGPRGALQSLADGVKLALKEGLIPAGVDKPIYLLAPIIAVIPAFTAFAVIPLGPSVSIFGHHTPLQLTDLPVAVLYILAITSIGVYGIVLAGWSSGSTYPLLGGLRSTAQVISYEIAMGLCFAAVFLLSATMSTSEIIASQHRHWFILLLLPSFIIYAISMVGETNRAPFDLPEGEPELIGYFVEYSGMRWGLFFLAEFIEIVFISSVIATVFFGGWQLPFLDADGFRIGGYVTEINHQWVSTGGWVLKLPHAAVTALQVGAFGLKVILLAWFQLMIRWTLPRFRADQLMNLGWKVLLPCALGWTMLTALFKLCAIYLGWL